MTTSQAIHHAEQMEAVRVEFFKFWASIAGLEKINSLPESSQIIVQDAAWIAFLHAKGLAK